MSDRERLQRLIQGGARCVLIPTFEEDYAVELVRDVAGILQRALNVWTCDQGLQTPEGNFVPETTEPVSALRFAAAAQNGPLTVFLDLAPHLEHERTCRAFRNALRHLTLNNSQVVLVDHSDGYPPVVRAHGVVLEPSLPDERELEQITRDTLRAIHQQTPIDIDIRRGQLQAIVKNLRGLSRRQAREVIAATVADDQRFDADDIAGVLAAKRSLLAGAGLLQFVSAPANLAEIGGLDRLKGWLEQRRRAFSDAAREFGIDPPRGVLLLGVQGAGKSLCAKAVATAWQRPLLRLDVGALYDRYVGESERRLRAALHQAEAMAPIILWIDEIEKAFASAASRSTDGGLSQRMFGALLTWMQEHTAPAFLVATANDIEALPPELLRKGRFDEIFFVDLPGDAARREIFTIHLTRRGRTPDEFDLDALVTASAGFSGAEIEQAILAGLHRAFDAEHPLDTAGILQVLAESPPLSVTMAERVAALRRWAQERCVPAE